MTTRCAEKVYILEQRHRLDRGGPPWSTWALRDGHHLSYRRAKLEREILNGPSGDPDYEVRVVTFDRGRCYPIETEEER